MSPLWNLWRKLYKDSECTVDCLLVYVAVEEQHEPIKSQCSVHLVRNLERGRGWERRRVGGREGKGTRWMEETRGEGRGTEWREEGWERDE